MSTGRKMFVKKSTLQDNLRVNNEESAIRGENHR